jgi:hypothetical protein
LCGKTKKTTPNKKREEAMTTSHAELDAWLKGVDPKIRPVDLFEMVISQGAAARGTVFSALRNFLGPDEPEVPGWLVRWAAKLTDDEIGEIEAKRAWSFESGKGREGARVWPPFCPPPKSRRLPRRRPDPSGG